MDVITLEDAKPSTERLDDPVDEVQENIRELITRGADALEYALDLAKQSDSPRAFEVVGALLKQMSDMNMQLLDAHDKKVKFRKPKEEEKPNVVNNNSIIFNGSTSEFNKLLEQMRNK